MFILISGDGMAGEVIHGEEKKTQATTSLQPTLANDAKRGIVGNAILVQTSGQYQNQSYVAGEGFRQIDSNLHLL